MNGWARLLLPFLLGAVLTGFGAYATLGQDVVHRGDLQNAIEHDSPFVRAQQGIEARLGAVEREEAGEAAAILKLSEDLHRLELQIATLKPRSAGTQGSPKNGASLAPYGPL